MIFDRTCPQCKKKYTPYLLKEDCKATHDRVRRWQGGTLIQNVWPNSEKWQREQLLTGLCSDICWERFLS